MAAKRTFVLELIPEIVTGVVINLFGEFHVND